MGEAQYIGVCCYRYRAVTYDRCERCQLEFKCPLFRSLPELETFNKLIPRSMQGAPLPLNLWPSLWKSIDPQTPAKSVSPVILLVEALVSWAAANEEGRNSVGQ
jgi:hypothetical protein